MAAKDMRSLMQERAQGTKKTKRAPTERGELLQWFVDEVNRGRVDGRFPKMTMPRMAKKLQGLDMEALYYMRSVMRDLEMNPPMVDGKRVDGYVRAQKWFFWSLDNKKHKV